MSDHMLSFEMDNEDGPLIIHGDEKGLKSLCRLINKLINNTKDGHFNHDHLMTPHYGSYELSERNMGGKGVNHVKIYCWKDQELPK